VVGEAGANSGAKGATVIGTALAGGDCIDDWECQSDLAPP
jgi:hypothetical protein